MMDMMTIILVFLLKSLSSSTAALPQSEDLQLPRSVLTTAPDSEPEGLPVIISKSQIIVGESVVCPVPPDAAQYGTEGKYKRGSRNDTSSFLWVALFNLGGMPTSKSERPPGKTRRRVRPFSSPIRSYPIVY
jgi:hypothetical protein